MAEDAALTAAVVRTPAGAKRYGQPIGSTIVPDAVPQTVERAARAVRVQPPHKGHAPTADEVKAAVKKSIGSRVSRGILDSAIYLEAAGYNDPPTVLPTKAFDAFKGKAIRNYGVDGKEERSEFWRGTWASQAGDPYMNLTTAPPDEYYVGYGIYTNGTHMGDEVAGQMFSGQAGPPPTRSRRFPNGSSVLRIKIHPDARVGRYDSSSQGALPPPEVVEWAVKAGYDVLDLSSTRDNAAGIAVLNRSVMVVEELEGAGRVIVPFSVGTRVQWFRTGRSGGKVLQGEVRGTTPDGMVLIRGDWGRDIGIDPKKLMALTGGGSANTGRVAGAGPTAERGLDVPAGSTDDSGLGSPASGLPGEGRGGIPQALGSTDQALTAAAGQSWRWQLRDKNGKWIQMGSGVRWLSRGKTFTGTIVGSPSPGVAIVEDDEGRQTHLPTSRMTAASVVKAATPKADPEDLQQIILTVPASERLRQPLEDIVYIIDQDVEPMNQAQARQATNDVAMARIVTHLPKATQALKPMLEVTARGKRAVDRLEEYIVSHERLGKLIDRAMQWADEWVGQFGVSGASPGFSDAFTTIGLPSPFQHPIEFITTSAQVFQHWIDVLSNASTMIGSGDDEQYRVVMTAAGDSWRWQLRDKNGRWIEMGSEVKWLAKGLYKRGVVIGSPSPGIAKVREHITALTRDIPSNRLQVVESAKNVLERAIEEGRTADFVKNPALADLAERAHEGAASLADWGKHLVPDEYQSVQDILTLTVPLIYNSLPRFGDWREQLADEVWKRIEVPAKELGFDENTGLIYAQGIGIKIIERLERERAWVSSDAFHTGLAPHVNNMRANGRVAIAVTPITMLDMLEGDGRYKTQFEIGESGGYYDPDLRAGYEAAMFGLHPDVNVEKRTVYGYVFTPGRADAVGVDQYGGVRIILKEAVRDRTTMTVGDSLGTGAVAPVPMTGPDVDDKEAYMASSTMGGTMQLLAGYGPDDLQDYDYFEAQIHGGVTLNDVEEIIFTSEANMDQDEIDYFASLAAYHGIKVRK